MNDLYMAAIGICAGVLAGVMGIGGGLIIVPLLVYVFAYPQHKAQGTSLIALLLPVGAMAAYHYWKAGQADIRGGLIIGLGIFAGAWMGALLAGLLSDNAMRKVFAVLLLAVSIEMFFKK